MTTKRVTRNVAALVMVVFLVLIAACVPVRGKVTPTPAPTVKWGAIELRVTDPPPVDVKNAFVTLTNMEVHRVGGGWEMISIPEATFDLLGVVGIEEVLGSANITAGSFTRIRMDVEEVEVVVATDNTTAEIIAEVPSKKLKIVKLFEVEDGVKTILTLDFDGSKSLVLTGKDKAGDEIKALFKPVVKVVVEKEAISEREKEKDRLGLELEGNVAPGETVTLLVTFNGEPVVGATVEVNGEEIGETGGDGTISFIIAEDADELNIDVKKGEQHGELEFEFEKEPESGLTLEVVEGNVAPGETVTLLVTFEGKPVAKAKVKVNGEGVGRTDENGTISFAISDDATDLVAEAKLCGREGELRIAIRR